MAQDTHDDFATLGEIAAYLRVSARRVPGVLEARGITPTPYNRVRWSELWRIGGCNLLLPALMSAKNPHERTIACKRPKPCCYVKFRSSRNPRHINIKVVKSTCDIEADCTSSHLNRSE